MNENDLERLLRKALFSEIGPNPSEDVIDAYLRSQESDSPDTIARVKKRFVEKVFQESNPELIRQVADNITFGDFLETQRTRAGLRQAEVSYAINLSEDQIDALEKGRTQPWKIAPKIAAEIMSVFRVHFAAFKQLVETSSAVGQVRGVGPVAARSKGGKMTAERGDSTSRALERFFVRNADRTEPNNDATAWLASLEGCLRSESAKGNYRDLI